MRVLSIVLFSLCVVQIAKGQWLEQQSLPDSVPSRNHAVTFELNGYGYMATGYNGDEQGDDVMMKDVLRYNPKTDAWEQMSDFPGPRRGFSYGLAYEGKGYMGFGLTMESSKSEYLDDLWEYDPAKDVWTELSSCPCEARKHPAFLEVMGVIYVGLGDGVPGNLNDWWAYDIATDTWTEKAELPAAARHHPFYFGIDSLAYAGFGHGKGKIYDDFYCYNPRTNKWKQIPGFPGEARVAGTQFDFQGKGYILSGQGASHDNLEEGEFWEFDPVTEEWDTLAVHPGSGRWAPATFIIGNELYFLTGKSDWGNESDLWSFQLPDFTSMSEPKSSVSKLSAYPNPANSQVNVSIKGDGQEFPYKLTLMNAVGQVLHSELLNANTETLTLNDYDAGVYFLRIESHSGGAQSLTLLIE